MKVGQITTFTISDYTGTQPPSAGANGQLGPLALQSQVNSISAGITTVLQGTVPVSTSTVTVTHPTVNVSNTIPFISLTTPVSGAILYIYGITNRTTNSFDVNFSSTPAVSGYYLNWQITTNGNSYVLKSSANYTVQTGFFTDPGGSPQNGDLVYII